MARTLDRSARYEIADIAWLEEQPAHPRAGRLHALGVEHVAEGFGGLMKTARREDSPSLRQELARTCQAAYPDAARQAAVQTLLRASVFSADSNSLDRADLRA